MKKNFYRIIVFLLCFCTVFPLNAFAVFPKTLLKSSETTLASGVSLNSNTFWKESIPDAVTENYITYKPNQIIKPIVVYGSKVCNYGNFEDMAELLEKRGYSVIAGINGDYYNTDTYQPLGIVITDGKLKSSDDGHYALGFKSDGTAIIGSPALNMSFSVGSDTYPLFGINKVRTGSGFYLFTEDFSYTTKSKDSGTEIICSIVKGDLTVNSELTLKVDSIAKSSGAYDLPAGKIVISLSESAPNQDVLKKLTAGTRVTVKVACADTSWNSVQFAVGSLYKLLTKGKIESGLESGCNPRTAVGIKPNGEIVLYTADGRQTGYSAGVSIDEAAERLLALGCSEACLMDGGGSTTMGAKLLGDNDYTVINRPSGGRMRYITEFIMLAAVGSGSASIMGVYPYDAYMLKGMQKTFTAGTADKYGNAKDAGSVMWSLKSGAGYLSSSGVFTAAGAGDVVIKASSGGLSATAKVTVVDAPDEISVKNEATGESLSSITLEAGQSISLSAEALYKHLKLDLSDTDFKWKITGSIASVDSSGKLSAGLTAGNGKLSVTAGSGIVEIPVKVELNISRLENFEGSSIKLSGAPQNATAILNTDIEKARFGKQSAEIKYDLSKGIAFIPLSLSIPSSSSFISVWIYGDSSNNDFSFITSSGKTEKVVLDFEGWKHILLENKSNITGIQVSGKGKGGIWIDQITAAPAEIIDENAPIISVSVKDSLLSGSISDDYDGSLLYDDIEVICDGKVIQYDYQNSQLNSLLPALDPKAAHRITVYAEDISGNRSRMSVDMPASTPQKSDFADISGHWSEKHVNYLSGRGVISGVSENKVLNYQPDYNMTREQFAVVMARYMCIDLTKYINAELSFADLKDISDYALPSVKAMYTLGIIKGIAEGNDLCFKPKEALTRAQAMTIIGRTMPAGYKTADLTAFSDAAATPSWALKYVGVLTSLGIVGGSSDGKLNPNASVTRAEVAKIITLMY